MNEMQALSRLKQKDAAALEALMAQYLPYVAAVIWNIIGQSAAATDCEELCSDVFLSLWEHGAQIRAGKCKAWLGAVARNRAYSALRSCAQELPLEEDSLSLSAAEPQTLLEQRERQTLVRTAVDALGEPDREIFLRHYYWGQTTEAIAEAMGFSAPALRQRLKRGRDRLRQTLEQGGINA